ncbi:MAG: hypothetical protein AAF502_22710 [Bacteroidota bacterium]
MKIAHIINPVKAKKGSDLFKAQPITFESMRLAQNAASEIVDVKLYTTQFPEDRTIIPTYFEVLPDLERSVLDVRDFQNRKKYPLIGDIINQIYQFSDGDYLVFTNVDIILSSDFYIQVYEKLNEGHDALIINRRRIPDIFNSPSHLPEIFKLSGKSHPGFDCFVFKRDLVTNMRFGKICVGVPFIGVTLAHNLFAFAESPKLLDAVQLTYHIGMKIMPSRDKSYYWHNRKEFNNIRDTYLRKHFDINKFPYAHLPFPLRYLKWALNPSLFVYMNFKLDLKRLKKRLLG